MAKPKRKEGGNGEAHRAPQYAGSGMTAELDRDRVARRAYELYLARGGSDGMAMDDWLRAEREVLTGASSVSER